MKLSLVLIFLVLFAGFVCAETTFFDNPDDAFIMGNPASATGEMIEETRGEAISGGGCLYKWNCTDWGECLPSGIQIRNCTNIGTCSSKYNPPKTEQNCDYTFIEELDKEGKEIINKNKMFIYFVLFLAILFIIVHLERNHFKKFYGFWPNLHEIWNNLRYNTSC